MGANLEKKHVTLAITNQDLEEAGSCCALKAETGDGILTEMYITVPPRDSRIDWDVAREALLDISRNRSSDNDVQITFSDIKR